jgi:hypothetical protein
MFLLTWQSASVKIVVCWKMLCFCYLSSGPFAAVSHNNKHTTQEEEQLITMGYISSSIWQHAKRPEITEAQQFAP